MQKLQNTRLVARPFVKKYYGLLLKIFKYPNILAKFKMIAVRVQEIEYLRAGQITFGNIRYGIIGVSHYFFGEIRSIQYK